jgi:formylmethanofuran dehydrogenase subunit E
MIFPQIEYNEWAPCECCGEPTSRKDGKVIDEDIFFCNPCVEEQMEWLP